MTGNIQYIDQTTYLRGFSPWESLFEFGPPSLIDELSALDSLPNSNMPQNANAPMAVQLLGILAGSLQELKNHNARRDEIIKSLKHDILNQIKRGDLIPFGFKEPRDISDLPIQIPADLLFSGILNWENGNLKYKNYEFSGVRLLADLMPVINSKAVYEENEIEDIVINKENTGVSQIPNLKNSNALNQNKKTNLKLTHKNHIPNNSELKKPRKQHFSDLDPALHIDEKKAAEYLGVSHKTLQGYRVKGGGPEYIKIGVRSVRYKIADLINWAENRKRKIRRNKDY